MTTPTNKPTEQPPQQPAPAPDWLAPVTDAEWGNTHETWLGETRERTLKRYEVDRLLAARIAQPATAHS